MSGLPRHTSRPHTGLPASFLILEDLTTERSFVLQATCVIDVLGLFFDVIHEFLDNQTLPDVRSTGSGIKYLYCMYTY